MLTYQDTRTRACVCVCMRKPIEVGLKRKILDGVFRHSVLSVGCLFVAAKVRRKFETTKHLLHNSLWRARRRGHPLLLAGMTQGKKNGH